MTKIQSIRKRYKVSIKAAASVSTLPTYTHSAQCLKASLVRQRKAVHQRRDWWHKIVHQLVNSYGLSAIENLNLSFMLRNGNLSRAAHDVALGIFYQLLDDKALEAGVEVVKVNPKNTSQRCSGCGVMVKKDWRVRTHHCPNILDLVVA